MQVISGCLFSATTMATAFYNEYLVCLCSRAINNTVIPFHAGVCKMRVIEFFLSHLT